MSEKLPYLVVGKVDTQHYQGRAFHHDDARIVMATSDEEAKQKYEDFWRKQTVEYDVYYSVYTCDVREPIL